MALFLSMLQQEKTRRIEGRPLPNVGCSWSRQFASKPSAFIAEVMGPAWLGADWLAWRSFVKVLFGEYLDAEELDLFRLCTGLEEPPNTLQREAWLPVGRRGGKSRIEAMIAVHLASCYDWTPYLAPGEKGAITVLADTRDHASAIMNYVKAAILGHPKLKLLVKRSLVESIELEGQVEIEVVTASIKAVRSRTVIAALLDEIAFWQPDETCANPDVEIINGLRPAMLTIPNSMQIAASSRYARKGVLWNAYRDYYGKPEGPLVWSASTETMHPSVDRKFLADERERDPLAAAAEYDLEWRSDVAAFVTREVVEAVVPTGVYEREPQPGVVYKAFTDPSGGSADSFTLAIGHKDWATGRGILDVVREVRPPFGPESVVGEFAELLRSYRIGEVMGDHYAGEWPREQFRKVGINYNLSEDAKSRIYQGWLPLLNSGKVELLDLPRLVLQACGLERRTSRVGKDTIDHAPGGHDDVVNAVAGVLRLVTDIAQPIVVSNEALQRSRLMAAGMRR
jgi:hypothetical protein